MRFYFSVFFLTCLHYAIGQTLASVHGVIVESSSRDPLGFSQVIIKQLPDSAIIKSVLADSLGKFEFDVLLPGHYFVEANLIGFETNRSAAFELKEGDDKNLGFISLAPSDFLLNEIEVIANNPSLISGIDRKIYLPENDIMARSGSVTDILENIPSVTIESEGEILLRGNGNITFLLNGKPSALLTNNAQVFLEQIPAHTIERIEVITNPSAKYKPDGTAGIINIVTKKNVLPGFNGNILANASTNSRYNGNISLNYNPSKFNLSVLYGYWQSHNPRTGSDFRIIRDSATLAETFFEQTSNAIGKPSSHTVTLGLDYQFDEKNYAGISGTFFRMASSRDADNATLEYSASETINQYQTLRSEIDREHEISISAFGEHTFRKEDHSLSIEAQYEEFDEKEDSEYRDIYQFPKYPESRGQFKLTSPGHASSLSVDYTNPLSDDIELEAGYEGEFGRGDFNFLSEYFDFSDLMWKNDVNRSNRFVYRQDINALYVSLSKSFDDFGILAGVRAEQTNIESNLVSLDSIVPNDYFNLFPTLHLSYELSDLQQLGLSYSRRVNRPDPDELNPFPEYVDIRDIEAGNPYLKPEQTHSIELGYQYQNEKLSLNPTLYFRSTYDAFSEVTRYINDTILLSTQENLESATSAGLEFVIAWSPSKKLNLNFNSNLFYHSIDAGNLGYADEKSIITSDNKLNAFYNVFSSTRFQVNTTFRSARLTAQGSSLPVYFINAGLRQELFGRKASLTLTVSDIFNTMKWRFNIDTPLLYQEVTRKRKSQIVYLGFSYRFGFSSKKNGEELLFDDRM